MIIVSIDIGYINMGFVKCHINENWQIKVLKSERINLKNLPHRVICRHECQLHHTYETVDLMEHFFQEYYNDFDDADEVLIERQPPQGFNNIEALIFSRWRNKSVLISPTSMHKHFYIGKFNYDNRKEETVKIASKYIDIDEDRKHDIADALCMIIFHIHDRKEKHRLKQIPHLPFEEFIYTGNKNAQGQVQTL